MTLDHAELFIALAIPGVGALWRAASLRGDMRKEWSPRVEDAEVGLADRGNRELLKMQQEITRLLGSGSAALPRRATANPRTLSRQIRDFQKTMAAVSRLQLQFRWLLRIGPLLIAASLLFLLGDAALFVNHSQVASSGPMRVAGLIGVATGGALGFTAVAAWVFLHFGLSGAELRATEQSDRSSAGVAE